LGGAIAILEQRTIPRVTPVGRWMRTFSIDEFPQLLNVVRGEMPLVRTIPPVLFTRGGVLRGHPFRAEPRATMA
jgi:lipopolysaccharide/colanic/teichoic acid biosynthesis glycosyltransferase